MRDEPLGGGRDTMLELHVLGTSSARFAHNRAVSGSFVMTPGGGLLVDCGEGLQQRLLNQNSALKKSELQIRCRMAKVRAILFTHGHLDHCWGLLPMLHTMALEGRTEPLTIIAPTSQKAIDWSINYPSKTPHVESGVDSTDLAILFQQWQSLGAKDEAFGFDIDWVLLPIEEESPFSCPIQPLKGVELTVVPTIHGVPSCAWMVATESGIGKFDREKVDLLNLTTEQIATLADGDDVELDGTVLRADDFRGSEKPPRSLIISGDTTGAVPAFSQLPIKPDLLLHEATFLVANQEKAEMYNHSTSHDAARHAQISNTEVLALTHYSSRITDSNVVEEEAKQLHKRSIASDDGDIFTISRIGEITLYRRNDSWAKFQL
jgi:ribonuclease Z